MRPIQHRLTGELLHICGPARLHGDAMPSSDAGFSVRQVAIQVALLRKAALHRESNRFLSACHFRVYVRTSCAEMRLDRLENRKGCKPFEGSNPSLSANTLAGMRVTGRN